jgi:hypothetical protein
MRVFYYDGALMEAMFAFQTDFSNSFLRKSFLRFKKRNQRFLGSRNGRFFLFIFYGLFRFSNFFKAKYLTSQRILQKGPLRFRLYLRRRQRVIRFLSLRRSLKRKRRALAKAKAIAKAKAQGKVYVPYRKPRKHVFFSYGPLFHSRSRKFRFFRQRGPGHRRPFDKRGHFGQRYALSKGASFKAKGIPYRPKPRFAHFNYKNKRNAFLYKDKEDPKDSFNYKKKWDAFRRREPFFYKADPKLIALKRQRGLESKRRRAVFKIFKGILRHCSLGRLGFYLKKVRWFLAAKLLLKAELKIFIIFIILFRRI